MSYEDYFDFLTEKEEENVERTRKELSEEFELSRETLEMLYDCFKAIASSYSHKWSHSKKAAFFILPRFIMSTKTSIELLTRAYYFDYEVVQRSLLESLALLMLFSEDEEAAKKWLDREELELPKWKLVHYVIPSPTKKMRRLIDKAYSKLSDYVHSSSTAIFREWTVHFTRRTKRLDFPKFDKSKVREELSSQASLLVIAALTTVFKEEFEESFRKRLIDFLERVLSKWIVEGLLEEHKTLLDD